MPHVVEPAKSGRAKCRACRKPIEKGSLRFGEEVLSNFGYGDTSHRWFHLVCAAERLPFELDEALATFAEEVGPDESLALIDDPDALKEAIVRGQQTAKPAAAPWAERAPSGRARCLHCKEAIAKESWRIAVEREVDTGAFVTTSNGYLHPACAIDWHAPSDDEVSFDAESLVDDILSNSRHLSADEKTEVEALLA